MIRELSPSIWWFVLYSHALTFKGNGEKPGSQSATGKDWPRKGKNERKKRRREFKEDRANTVSGT